jgi:hypothetical protein
MVRVAYINPAQQVGNSKISSEIIPLKALSLKGQKSALTADGVAEALCLNRFRDYRSERHPIRRVLKQLITHDLPFFLLAEIHPFMPGKSGWQPIGVYVATAAQNICVIIDAQVAHPQRPFLLPEFRYVKFVKIVIDCQSPSLSRDIELR